MQTLQPSLELHNQEYFYHPSLILSVARHLSRESLLQEREKEGSKVRAEEGSDSVSQNGKPGSQARVGSPKTTGGQARMESPVPTAVDGWLENLPELSATVTVLSCRPLPCRLTFMPRVWDGLSKHHLPSFTCWCSPTVLWSLVSLTSFYSEFVSGSDTQPCASLHLTPFPILPCRQADKWLFLWKVQSSRQQPESNRNNLPGKKHKAEVGLGPASQLYFTSDLSPSPMSCFQVSPRRRSQVMWPVQTS